VLDRGILDGTLQRMEERAARLGVVLWPHLKTAKSINVAGRLRSRDRRRSRRCRCDNVLGPNCIRQRQILHALVEATSR
jgi:hypothetical protein